MSLISVGCSWSSSLHTDDPHNAYGYYFGNFLVLQYVEDRFWNRYLGLPVRPVYEEDIE